MNTESNVLERIRQRDEDAFKSVYEKYYPKVYTYALRYLKSETDAEEVVHEVFLKLWMRDANALPIRSLDAYFQTVTRNRSLDILRRKVLEQSSDLNSAVNWREDHNETEELILLKDTKKVLKRAIELLPAKQRLVYLLCREEGLKYEQVAEKLQISPATVQTHMKLALKFLRAYVAKHTDLGVLLIILKLI